jgi:hypothetical protein
MAVSEQFDLKQVLTSIAASMVNTKLNSSMSAQQAETNDVEIFANQLGRNLVVSMADMGVESAITLTSPNLEGAAAQALGTTIGTPIGEHLGAEITDLAHPYQQVSTSPQFSQQVDQTEQKLGVDPRSPSQPDFKSQQSAQQQTRDFFARLNASDLNDGIADQKLPSVTIDLSNSATATADLTSASAASSASAGQLAFGSQGLTLAQTATSAISAATNRNSFFNSSGRSTLPTLPIARDSKDPLVAMGVVAPSAMPTPAPTSISSNPTSMWSKAANIVNEAADSKFVAEINGIGSGVANTFIKAGSALLHPIDNIIKPTAQLVMDVSVLAFDNDAVDTTQAAARMDTRWSEMKQAATTTYSNLTSSNPYMQGRAIGGLLATVGTFAYGGDVAAMVGEGTENAAARTMFELTASPNPEGAMTRQAAMLSNNVGYNISPTSWFRDYPAIGPTGTYLTDYRTVGEVLGPIRPNQEFSVGLFSSGNQFSFFKARTLELNLGLEPSSLSNGFRFSSVTGINRMNLLPVEQGANSFFLGVGQGLPNGGPEIKVDPIPTSPWPWKFTI